MDAGDSQPNYLDGGENVGGSLDAAAFGLDGTLATAALSGPNAFFSLFTLSGGFLQLHVSDAGASALGLDDDKVYPVTVTAGIGSEDTASLDVGVWLDRPRAAQSEVEFALLCLAVPDSRPTPKKPPSRTAIEGLERGVGWCGATPDAFQGLRCEGHPPQPPFPAPIRSPPCDVTGRRVTSWAPWYTHGAPASEVGHRDGEAVRCSKRRGRVTQARPLLLQRHPGSRASSPRGSPNPGRGVTSRSSRGRPHNEHLRSQSHPLSIIDPLHLCLGQADQITTAPFHRRAAARWCGPRNGGEAALPRPHAGLARRPPCPAGSLAGTRRRDRSPPARSRERALPRPSPAPSLRPQTVAPVPVPAPSTMVHTRQAADAASVDVDDSCHDFLHRRLRRSPGPVLHLAGTSPHPAPFLTRHNKLGSREISRTPFMSGIRS